ncbi:heavy-metal-associated domain-containing protein [Bosea sp. NBC_00550]|uniref:heavy-metal-associated domain-containing protein n=1 Tax=Bosea sp. NBC_00550 TaxID=2969621 RepID=UPI0022329C89|nr:heavy-metal-associated domain-containing protein [Bosea sp. NBC_00550]UZF92842.1 heavy-metal-associated domain-containing protein [Bosea sp. NBC_00550]
MSCCQQHAKPAAETIAPSGDAVTFQVEDMTCGHCAGTIKGAIETRLLGTSVTADPGSKRVSVLGSSDYAAIKAAVSAAGYTPGPERIG